MKPLVRPIVIVALSIAVAVPLWAGEVKVSFSNGLITIVATDASPRQILAEWARLGQVRITNLERLAGAPITLQITDAPEAQALETLLRSTAGYVAAPRMLPAAIGVAVSRYDRIVLMPGSAPVAPAAMSSVSPPGGGRGRPAIQTYDPVDDDNLEQPRPMPGPSGAAAREGQRTGGGSPVPGQFTPGQVVMPGQTLAPGQVATPGQYTQPGSVYQPTPGSAQPPTRQIITYSTPQPPGASGTAVPGMPTAPAPLPNAGYSVVQPGYEESGMVQGQPAILPGQTPAATRPGATAAPTPGMFRNPYGLPDVGQQPAVDSTANPYGLPNPVRTPAATTTTPATTPGAATPGAATPGTTTTPTRPIKKSPDGKG